jgi:hypothetical protein
VANSFAGRLTLEACRPAFYYTLAVEIMFNRKERKEIHAKDRKGRSGKKNCA